MKIGKYSAGLILVALALITAFINKTVEIIWGHISISVILFIVAIFCFWSKEASPVTNFKGTKIE